MAQLRDLTETFAGYRATMEKITNETIIAIHQLQQLTDWVRQTTMQSLHLHRLEGHELNLQVAELKDQMERVMRQVKTLCGAQAPGRACLDNRIDIMENQLEVLKFSLASLEQEIAGLSQAEGDHLHGLREVQAGLQSIKAKADQADEAVRAASDRLKVISSKMDHTSASVVAQAEHLQLQMEEIKAIDTRLSAPEALGPTHEAAESVYPSQVNVLLEALARIEQEEARYKGATTKTQQRHEEVLREAHAHVVQLGIRILKTGKDCRGLKTRDQVRQLEVRGQRSEGFAQNIEGLKTSPAPGLPEGFYPNVVAHLARELGQVKSYFEG